MGEYQKKIRSATGLKRSHSVEESTFDKWMQLRQLRLNLIPLKKRKEIELIIEKQLIKNMNKDKGDYLSYAAFTSIPEINAYFKIQYIISERNNGKTTAAKKELLKENEIGRSWAWLKNDVSQAKKVMQANSEWAMDNGWFPVNEHMTLWNNKKDYFRGKGIKKGLYAGVSTLMSLKGTEHKTLYTLYWDEFNVEGGRFVHEKWKKLTSYIITQERFKQDFRVILNANYSKDLANDEMLNKLNITKKDWMTKNKIIRFDWILGAIVWTIPQGFYKSLATNIDSVSNGFIASDFDSYKESVGSSVEIGEAQELWDWKAGTKIEPLFRLFYHQENKPLKSLNWFWMPETKKIFVCKNEIIIWKWINKDLVMDKKTKLRKINAEIMNNINKEKLFNLFVENKITTNDFGVLRVIREIIDNIIYYKKKSSFLDDVEEI